MNLRGRLKSAYNSFLLRRAAKKQQKRELKPLDSKVGKIIAEMKARGAAPLEINQAVNQAMNKYLLTLSFKKLGIVDEKQIAAIQKIYDKYGPQITLRMHQLGEATAEKDTNAILRHLEIIYSIVNDANKEVSNTLQNKELAEKLTATMQEYLRNATRVLKKHIKHPHVLKKY